MIKLYKKYEEIINYLIVGFLTTLISMVTYYLFSKVIHINYLIANILSWIFAVLFAFVANKFLVFKSKNKDFKKVLKEAFDFFIARILSLIIDLFLMWLLVSIIKIDDMIAKLIVQFVIIVLNYIFSKLFIFKK
ncbi:MAG: GtrA family protein [Bacilli bacterium]